MTDLIARKPQLSEVAATIDLPRIFRDFGAEPVTAYDFAEKVMDDTNLSYEESVAVLQELIESGSLLLTDHYSVEASTSLPHSA